MADDRDDRRIVGQLLRDANCDFGAAAVVHDTQRQRLAADSPVRVDFFDGQLSGVPHGDATRLGEGSSESENNRFSAAGTGAGGNRENRGEKSPAPAHERARLSLRMG